MKNNKILTPIPMFLFGAVLGVISKLLDTNSLFLNITISANLGNIFSQMSVWILLGTLIAIFSKTKGRAALNVFVFCAGMLIAYYNHRRAYIQRVWYDLRMVGQRFRSAPRYFPYSLG